MDHDNPILSKQELAAPSPQEIQSLRGYMLNEAQIRLEPADPEEIVDQLTPVLALVGAVGMSQDDRAEWLVAATDALKDIPRDLLSEALRECRRRADHPSRVIPFVTDYCEERIGWRRKQLESAMRSASPPQPALVAPGQSFCTAEEAAEIVDRVFPQARQAREVAVKVDRGPPKMPTRADYIALGVDPACLDQNERERAA